MNKVIIFFLLCSFHINASEVIIYHHMYDIEKTTELKLMGTNISDNDLENICKLTNLQNLDIRDNKIEFLPEAIGNLTNLEVLNVGSNEITILPEAIGNLTKLTSLNIASNKIEKLPLSIANLTNLSLFVISWYKSKNIAKDNFEILFPLLDFHHDIFIFINKDSSDILTYRKWEEIKEEVRKIDIGEAKSCLD